MTSLTVTVKIMDDKGNVKQEIEKDGNGITPEVGDILKFLKVNRKTCLPDENFYIVVRREFYFGFFENEHDRDMNEITLYVKEY